MNKEWRDIANFNRYQISNYGDIFDKKRNLFFDFSNCTNSIYLMVSLVNETTRKGFTIHRLVALTFIPNPDNKPIINHINGNKRDNNVLNLEWCTYSENTIHYLKNGGIERRKYLKEFYKNILNITPP